MTPSHAKGTKHETALNNYLMEFFPDVYRLGNQGRNDKGDHGGIKGLVIQDKTGDKRYEIPHWLAQTEVQRLNAGAELGLLSVKPKGIGVTRVGDWWVIKPWWQEVKLLKLAGF
jgi:hypothetical protein